MTGTTAHPTDPRARLRPDCASCAALCCTLLGFVRSADFPVDKPAGTPCVELRPDHRCGIHDRLRPRGFRGCTVFECFGAGQRVTAGSGAPGDGGGPGVSGRPWIAAVFALVRRLHEAAWYLAEVTERSWDPELVDAAAALRDRLEAAASGPDDAVLAVDVDALLAAVRALLHAVSDEVRARYRATDASGPDEPGADLAGRDLRGTPLVGALLRNAALLAADLRGADLTGTDLLGADLRDARLDGADLGGALFLTQPQVNAARGDAATVLPPTLARPGHWVR